MQNLVESKQAQLGSRRLSSTARPVFRFSSDFRPHILFRSGHLQTVAGAYWPKGRPVYEAQQHRIELTEGDQTILHDDCPADWQAGQRCVLLIHGLGGCHQSPYLVRMVAKLKARGIRAFRMDMRGCGAAYKLSQHAGHAGRSPDVAACLEKIVEVCPGSPITAVGFSLGGNLVLKLAGETGANTPKNVDSVMAVAPPINLEVCAQNIAIGANQIYAKAFIRSLLRQIHKRRDLVPILREISIVPSPRTMREFDERVTSRMSGFNGARDYYDNCSAAPLLANIQIPTLILSAEDDPLIPVRMFRETPLSPLIELHLTRHGGHVGYLGASGVDPDRHWMDWRVLEWVNHFPNSK